MTAVSYLRLACDLDLAPSLVEQVLANSIDALARLPHDHTVRFHATVVCEALARLGDWPRFGAEIEKYRQLLSDQDETLWMWSEHTRYNVPEKLLLLDEMLRTQDDGQAIRLFGKLVQPPRLRFMSKAGFQVLRNRLGFWRALWQRLRVL